jgi:hypothetical protein
MPGINGCTTGGPVLQPFGLLDERGAVLLHGVDAARQSVTHALARLPRPPSPMSRRMRCRCLMLVQSRWSRYLTMVRTVLTSRLISSEIARSDRPRLRKLRTVSRCASLAASGRPTLRVRTTALYSATRRFQSRRISTYLSATPRGWTRAEPPEGARGSAARFAPPPAPTCFHASATQTDKNSA